MYTINIDFFDGRLENIKMLTINTSLRKRMPFLSELLLRAKNAKRFTFLLLLYLKWKVYTFIHPQILPYNYCIDWYYKFRRKYNRKWVLNVDVNASSFDAVLHEHVIYIVTLNAFSKVNLIIFSLVSILGVYLIDSVFIYLHVPISAVSTPRFFGCCKFGSFVHFVYDFYCASI